MQAAGLFQLRREQKKTSLLSFVNGMSIKLHIEHGNQLDIWILLRQGCMNYSSIALNGLQFASGMKGGVKDNRAASAV